MLSCSTLSEYCAHIFQCDKKSVKIIEEHEKRSNKVLDQVSNSCLVQKDSKKGLTCV